MGPNTATDPNLVFNPYRSLAPNAPHGQKQSIANRPACQSYGNSDLSARLGVHLPLEHPTFKAAVHRIAEACNARGKLARGSAETEAQIEEYWRLGCKVLNLPGNDVSTYLDGLKARAGRPHALLKSIGVPTPLTSSPARTGSDNVAGEPPFWPRVSTDRIAPERLSLYGCGKSASDPRGLHL